MMICLSALRSNCVGIAVSLSCASLVGCTTPKSPNDQYRGDVVSDITNDVAEMDVAQVDVGDAASTDVMAVDAQSDVPTDVQSDVPSDVGCMAAVQTDRMNCGACGRVCPGAEACVAGHCAGEIKQLIGGFRNSCVLTYGGNIRCWGGNDDNESNSGTTRANSIARPIMNQPMNVTAIGEQSATVCALVGPESRMLCWGFGNNGQLGDGRTNNFVAVPQQVTIDQGMNPATDLVNVEEMAFGASHLCARTRTGELYCWGFNAAGQVGDGSMVTRTRAVRVMIPPDPMMNRTNVLSFAGNDGNSYVVRADGQVLSWGQNLAGQLGIASPLPRTTPGVAGTAGVRLNNAVKVFAGGNNACALLDTGALYCWGPSLDNSATINTPTEFLPGNVVVGAHIGFGFICALREDRTVWCAGKNNTGQLGDGTTTTRAEPAPVPMVSDVVAISGGRSHTCVLLRDDSVKCWGLDEHGQLGSGRTLYFTSPNAVQNLVGTPHQVSAGETATCYRSTGPNTEVLCFGLNSHGDANGRDSVPQTSPVRVVTNGTSAQIVAGLWSVCSATFGQRVECWGSNEFGQIADGSMANPVFAPTLLPGLVGVLSLGDRYGSICAVHNGAMRTLSCWGRNFGGAVDPAINGVIRTPRTQIGSGVTAAAPGYTHICAIMSATNRAVCWGSGNSGEYGNGDMQGAMPPRSAGQATAAPVEGRAGDGTPIPYTFFDLASGNGFTCGITGTRNVVCWGANGTGQLAQPLSAGSARPLPVSLGMAPDVQQIEAGTAHVCARLGNGQVYCWGDNTEGQSGGPLAELRYTAPHQVTLPAGTTALSIAAGNHHTCARLSDNTLQCWGSNIDNQCGTSVPIYRTTAITAMLR